MWIYCCFAQLYNRVSSFQKSCYLVYKKNNDASSSLPTCSLYRTRQMMFVYTVWKYVYNQSLGAILKTKRICFLFKGMLCKMVGRISLLPFSPTQRGLDSAAIWGINVNHLRDEVELELNQSTEIYFLFILFVS